MAYNFLRTASSIRNSFLCVYDNLSGYSSDFHINGDVNGWDIYNNIYLYGCWSGVLFGTAFDRNIYISRTEVFEAVEAEDYYFLNIMMKITNNNPDKVVQGLTTGRVQWTRIDDGTFNSDKQYDFDLIADDKWHLYSVSLGPAQWWQGDINNLRVYPFVDGWKGDQFAIKFIKITALNRYSCTNTQCSYYLNYEHECPGAGSRGSCRAGTASTTYTTVSGVSDSLKINIDGYGEEIFELGNNENVRGSEMAKIIAGKISSVSVGGYNFAEVEYDEYYKLKIYSGTIGSTSSVQISYSEAAEALGFYSAAVSVSENESGTSSATGFDYASSRFLTAVELNKLVDGRTNTFAYEHDPLQYSVEGGRRDYIEMGTSSLISAAQDSVYYETLSNIGRTIIDLSHPFNNNGKVQKIYVYGQADETSKIKILRRNKNGILRVIHSIDFPDIEPASIYTKRPNIYRIDCDVIVNKGDLIGIYGADLFVGRSLTGLPDATFYQVDGEVAGSFDPGHVNSFGLTGFAIYARGNRLQNNTILDIDLGTRTNIEELNIHGSEDVAYFEYNIASCLDVTWDVDLFGGTHWHRGYDSWASNWWTQEHTNIYYGKSCLDDSIKTADNGKQGDSFGADNGVSTIGEHAYFYVNGDAEWLYQRACDGTHEYCGQYISNVSTFQYDRDPIAFTLYFPYGYSTNIHKTIMYFKERNNFRSIMLSYAPSVAYFDGNADIDSFEKVPASSYNSVTLDGIVYLPDDDYVILDYLFKNPTNQDIIYATRGVSDPINWEEYKAALQADWTTIAHTFDPVDCIGFRIYTDHHYSTKISEIEVYSKMDTTPSLVDNVTLSFSDYGEDWSSVTFNEVSSTKITGFLGGAPRYLRLEFEAATTFTINEIECFVGDQVKSEECSDVILLDNARSNFVNDSTPIVLENVYGNPYDLVVDIPQEISEDDSLVFWSRLGSYDEIDNPEIGPGSILHKSENYSLRNDNAQCATNVPCYGLINLVHDKNAYYREEEGNWLDFGTLTSGISISYCNKPTIVKSTYEFNPVSSQYWKIETHNDAVNTYDLLALFTYYEGNEVSIDNIYVSGKPGKFSDKIETTMTESVINDVVIFEEDFDSATFSGTWVQTSSEPGSYFIYDNDEVRLGFMHGSVGPGGNGDPTGYLYLTGPLPITHAASFDLEIEYEFRHITGQVINLNFDVHLLDDQDNIVAKYTTGRWDYTGAAPWPRTVNDGVNVISSTATEERTSVGTRSVISRRGNQATMTIYNASTGAQLWTGSTTLLSQHRATQIRIGFTSSTDLSSSNYYAAFRNITLTAVPQINAAETIVFEFSSGRPIDEIKLFSTAGMDKASVLISTFDSDDYNYWASNVTYSEDMTNVQTVNTTFIQADTGTSSLDNAFDGNISSWWQSDEGYPHWYGYDLGVSDGRIINRIRISLLDPLTNYPDGGNLYVQASNSSNSDWTSKSWSTLFSMLGDDLTAGWNTIDFSNTIYYRYYRLYVDSSVSWTRFNVRDTEFIKSISASTTLTITDSVTYYNYLAIDLELRRDLGIIRNYGTLSDKLVLAIGANVEYSNTVTTDVNSVVWNNTTYSDAQWMRVPLLCGDSTDRCIDKLGIYPDITTAYCQGGGYNCEWQSLGTKLTDYNNPINVAYGTSASGTNYWFLDYYPTNAVDGITDDYQAQSCWGFQAEDGVDPYIEIDFEGVYEIDKVVLYHGNNPNDSEYMNTDYTFSVTTSGSGDYFTTVFTESSNTEHFRVHTFVPVQARRVRLTITGYDSGRFYVFDEDLNEYIVFLGSFLREIEIYSYVDEGYVNSEYWPIVCMNLVDQFSITNHALINKDIEDTNTNWDNNEDFFQYSDNVWDDPEKVTFARSGSEVEIFYSGNSTDNAMGFTEYIFESSDDPGIVIVGDVQVSTSAPTGYNNSYRFPANNNYVTVANSDGLDFGSGDFTIDWWEYRESGSNVTMAGSVTGAEPYLIGYSSGSNLLVYMSSNNSTWDIANAKLMSTGGDHFNRWIHYAVVRSGINFYVFKDGVEQSTWTSPLALYDTDQTLQIAERQSGRYFKGWMSEIRFSKGIARWVLDFTPPSSPYVADGYTTLLIHPSASTTYFEEGFYNLEWQAYDVDQDDEISMRLEGPAVLDSFADTISDGTWSDQMGFFNVPISGFYIVKARQHIDINDDWGARQPYIYRTAGLTKWVAVTRDIATNYAYDGDSDKYGIDYLTTIKIFGDEKYNPTEYNWWWDSTLSTLENDSLTVKTGRKSLRIDYPTSSGSDILSFIEGDDWGTDVYFSEKDFLNFWLFLENVNKLDTDFGDIAFGIINSSNQAYYRWDISNLSLSTGWNSVKLKFEDADSFVSTAEDTNSIYRYINSNLNFRTNNRDMQSFRLRYRGRGQAFSMNIDDLNITRNVFDDDVKFGKGLYLTGHDYLNIPLSTMTLEKGSVEFWFRMTTDTYGLDKFGEIHSRTLFTIISNNNELVSLAIKSGYWFQPGAGHARRSLLMFDVDGTSLPLQLYFNIDDLIHLALVWSNDGSNMPNKDTVRFYINGELLAVSRAAWEVGDTKSAVIRLGGNSAQIAHNKDMYSSGLFDNVKLYNYCKTNFNPNMLGIERDITYTPNQFMEISSDNSTFYGVDSDNLPIVFEQVPDNESRTIYVRANKNENFKQSKKDASLIIQWIVSV